MWTWIFGSAAILGTLFFVWACFAVVRSQGRLERRTGAQVHADLVAREDERDSRIAGEEVGVRRSWAGGTGAEIGGDASISWDALLDAWQRKDREVLRPWLLLATSAAAMLVFGATTLILLGGAFALVGIAFVLVGIRLTWVVRRNLVARVRGREGSRSP